MLAAAAIARVESDISAIDFAALIRPGDRVLVGQGGAEALTLTRQLVAQKDRIGPYEVFLGPLYSDTFTPEKCVGMRFAAYGAFGRAASLSGSNGLEIVRQPYGALTQSFASGALSRRPLPLRSPNLP